MHYPTQNYKSYGYDNSKQLRAEQRNRKYDGSRRRELDNIKKTSPIENLVNAVKNYSTSPEAKITALMAIVLLLGAGAIIYNNNRQRIDKYEPKIEIDYKPSANPGLQRFNVTSIDYINARNETGPIARLDAQIKNVQSGQVINPAIKQLEGSLFGVEANITDEGSYELEVKSTDPHGNVAEKTCDFVIENRLLDDISNYAAENDIPRETVLELHSKHRKPLEDLYIKNKPGLEQVFELAKKNVTASELLIDKIERDSGMKTEDSKVWADVSSALNQIDVSSLTRRQASYINNLTDRHNKNVLTVYSADTISDVLDVIRDHPDINKGYRQELSDWLTFLLKEYPHAANYPFAVHCYGKQAESMFNDWMGLNCTSPQIMDLTIENLQKIVSTYESGESIVSLKEDELPWEDPVVRENNMRGKLLPSGIFVINPEIRDFAFGDWNPYNIPDKTKHLEMMAKNLDYFDRFHDEVWSLLKDEDSVERQKALEWWDIRVDKMSRAFEPLMERFKAYNRAIFENGTIERDAALTYGYADYWIWEVKEGGEQRIALSQGYGWAVGLPLGWMRGRYPYDPQYPQGVHSELAYPITDEFKNILLNNPEKYGTPVIDPNTQSISFYCCEEGLRETGIPYVFIVLPSLEEYYLYGKPAK